MASETRKSALSLLDNPILLGKRADELSLLIERQIEPIFEQRDIIVPVRSCSLLLFLDHKGSASAADLARELGISHQLVLQKIPVLIKRKLIQRRDDPEDRRRRLFSLTSEGKRQVERLNEHSADIQRVYHELYAEAGVDLFEAMGNVIDALKSRDLLDRLNS